MGTDAGTGEGRLPRPCGDKESPPGQEVALQSLQMLFSALWPQQLLLTCHSPLRSLEWTRSGFLSDLQEEKEGGHKQLGQRVQ